MQLSRVHKIAFFLRGLRLPPRRRRELRSSDLLRSEWW